MVRAVLVYMFLTIPDVTRLAFPVGALVKPPRLAAPYSTGRARLLAMMHDVS